MKLRPCLGCFFSSLNFYHSIFVTHHSSLITLNTTPVWHHHSIFFTLFVGPIPVTHCKVFIFYFSLEKILTKPTEKKEKKKNRTANQEKGKKKVKSGQKLRLGIVCGPLCVFNYNIVIKLWVMETENSQNVFSVFITHNLKIRELSDGNRVIVYQTTFLLWIPPFLSYKLWKLRIELRNLPIQTASKSSTNVT